ncbi:hypothetical protein JCM6882_003583 [Rhodosporidiobolus microsporus]
MSSSRSAAIDWRIPAVQRAYRNALEECHRQVGNGYEGVASYKLWDVDGDRLKLNEAAARLMQKELAASGHGDIARRLSGRMVSDYRHRERRAREGRTELAGQAQERAQALAAANNPHVAVARDAPLEQPVLRAPTAEVNPPPDDEIASYSYRGRRSPPYSHVNPQDLYRHS